MKFKRLAAYLFDVIIISIISSLIFTTVFKQESEEYTKNSQEYIQSIMNTGSGIEEDDYLEETYYKMQKNGQTYTVISVSIQILYFIFLQFFLNGQTIGKKLLKLRVVQEGAKKLDAGLFVLRCLILYSIPIKIIDLICLMNLNMKSYFNVSSILNKINMVIIIAIMGTIIFREDERGLHDIIAKTKVVSTKKKIKEENK